VKVLCNKLAFVYLATSYSRILSFFEDEVLGSRQQQQLTQFSIDCPVASKILSSKDLASAHALGAASASTPEVYPDEEVTSYSSSEIDGGTSGSLKRYQKVTKKDGVTDLQLAPCSSPHIPETQGTQISSSETMPPPDATSREGIAVRPGAQSFAGIDSESNDPNEVDPTDPPRRVQTIQEVAIDEEVLISAQEIVGEETKLPVYDAEQLGCCQLNCCASQVNRKRTVWGVVLSSLCW
jgi:hypothetical protein